MKYLAPILLTISIVMACFTEPKGVNGLWIASDQVVGVTHAVDCAEGAKTKITTTSSSFCVLEEPQEVLRRLTPHERH